MRCSCFLESKSSGSQLIFNFELQLDIPSQIIAIETVLTLKTGSHVRCKHKHKKKYVSTGTTQAQASSRFTRTFFMLTAYACAFKYVYACVVRVNQP